MDFGFVQEGFGFVQETDCLVLPNNTYANEAFDVSSATLIPIEDIEFEVADATTNEKTEDDILKRAVAVIDQLLPQIGEFSIIQSPEGSLATNSGSPRALTDDDIGSSCPASPQHENVTSPRGRSSNTVGSNISRANETCKRYRENKKKKDTAMDILLKHEIDKNKRLRKEEAILASKVKKLKDFYIGKINCGHVHVVPGSIPDQNDQDLDVQTNGSQDPC